MFLFSSCLQIEGIITLSFPPRIMPPRKKGYFWVAPTPPAFPGKVQRNQYGKIPSYGPTAKEFKKIMRHALKQPLTTNSPLRKKKYYFNNKYVCKLKCTRCQHVKKVGNRRIQCRRNSCISLPYCWQHLISVYKVRVSQTELRYKRERLKFVGLFACDSNKTEHQVVFRKNQIIIPYWGQKIKQRKLDKRYGEEETITAPYAIQNRDQRGQTDNKFLDSACHRSAASDANSGKLRRNSNAIFWQPNLKTLPVIMALKDIYNGEEILAWYGSGYQLTQRIPSKTTNTSYKLKPCTTK